MYFEEKLRQGLSLTYMECFKKNLDDIIQMLLNTNFVSSTPVMLNARIFKESKPSVQLARRGAKMHAIPRKNAIWKTKW